ncbi:hypothetical protein CDES_04820 [Corynebacterium deserti GIMN1.010]|uniref:DUF4307 domain-containing protein n=1 Tax=Corynebacterium deserti GIMN1.010 TaxID=931089 RepID=A0A0M5ILF3_9CORY|nr:DUF4307 domain-containing protein [Corynebacterium deserti]ALC05406.1 hypothetical protein CDES_04820 [Corynebacterium deserti GIMN1.010]
MAFEEDVENVIMSSNSNSPSNASGSSNIPGQASPQQSARPAGRYNARRPEASAGRNISGKIIAIVGVLLIIAIVIVGANFLKARDSQTVSGQMGAFERIDDDTFRFEVDVTRDDPSQVAYCIVTAKDYSHAEVGRREVLVEPSEHSTVRISTLIPTRDIAVSGGVYGCSTKIPSHMNL